MNTAAPVMASADGNPTARGSTSPSAGTSQTLTMIRRYKKAAITAATMAMTPIA